MPTNCRGRSRGIRLCGRCTSLALIPLALTWPACEPHANLRRGLGTSSLSGQPLHSDHPGSPAKGEVILRGQPAISATEVFQASSSPQMLNILPRHMGLFLHMTSSSVLAGLRSVPALPRGGVCE